MKLRASKFALKDEEPKKWRNYLLGVWRRHQSKPAVAELYQSKLLIARQLLQAWVADYPDPDNFLRVNSIRGETGWQNQAYDRLIEEARQLTDQGERMRLYQAADRILVEEAVVVPLLYFRSHMLLKPWVKRYPTSADSQWIWKDVIIEPH